MKQDGNTITNFLARNHHIYPGSRSPTNYSFINTTFTRQ